MEDLYHDDAPRFMCPCGSWIFEVIILDAYANPQFKCADCEYVFGVSAARKIMYKEGV